MRPDARVEAIAGDEYEPELEVDLFSLLAAFRSVLERARERPPMVLPPEQISIEARIEQLLERLSETEACGFEDLFEDGGGSRRHDRHVPGAARDDPSEADSRVPAAQLGAIRVYKRARPPDAPHPIGDPEDEYKAHHPRSRGGAASRRSSRMRAEPDATSADEADAERQ